MYDSVLSSELMCLSVAVIIVDGAPLFVVLFVSISFSRSTLYCCVYEM